jgi:phosphopantothenoylcysteine synthetase/decarboxylase
VLYLVVCGSSRAAHADELVSRAQLRGWDVWVIATPDGLNFIQREALEQQAGHPVLWQFRQPNEKKVLPLASGVIVCPATFNSICKLAVGISDNLALGAVIEAIGSGLPVVVCPALNSAQAAHWAFGRHLDELRDAGVSVLYGPGVYEPTALEMGRRPYPWDLPLDSLEQLLARR